MNPNEPTPRYSRYVLGVLVVVYVFNFLDRQIVSILAERIKADIGATDAQMGFLYGTAFAVFYALFGIPLGRLADVWDRRRLIAIGLAFWSLMTALSGLARTFTQLAAARIGVGVGEASATPAAFSLLSDTFPAARRATALAIYSSGIYIGAGLGLGVGGLIVERWDVAWAGAVPPFGLRGWQVAFLAVGLPGLLLSLWVATLGEPVRGAMDGLATPPPREPHPFRAFALELRSVLPPLTLLHLALVGAGTRAILRNLAWGIGFAAGAAILTAVLGTPVQWIALAIGLYAAFSWAQALALRDPPAYELIFRSRALRLAALGFSFLAFTGYGVGFWLAPFLIRVHGASESEIGLILGGSSALGGWIGTTFGGVLADRWRQQTRTGRLSVGILTALSPLPVAIWMFTTESLAIAYALSFPLTLLTSLWLGAAGSTVQDLVLPRMRATASAAYLFTITFIGLAMGPYLVGLMSVVFGDLSRALLFALFANLVAGALLFLAGRHLEHDETTLIERAQAAGERR